MSLTEAKEEEAARRVHATHERLVKKSDELSGEPANRPTNKRRPSATDTMQALKASRKISRIQSHTGGSNEGDSITQEGSKNESNQYDKAQVDEEEIEWVSINEEEEKQDDQDDDNDRRIDIEETDDDDDEKTDDEFVYVDKYVHHAVDENMKDAEYDETRKDNEEITDVEKTETTKGDYEQARKLPLTSSSLFVSSGFVPQIQSPSLLKIPVSMILKQTIPATSPVLSTVTRVSTVPPPPPIVSVISYVQQQTKPIPTPPITTIALSVTTTVLDPIPTIVPSVSEWEKDITELKQVDHSSAILATISSQVPSTVNEYLGLSLGDSLQKYGLVGEIPGRPCCNEKIVRVPPGNETLIFFVVMEAKMQTSNTPPKAFKSGKSVYVEEPKEAHVHVMSLDVEENIVDEMGNPDEQPDGETELNTNNAPKTIGSNNLQGLLLQIQNETSVKSLFAKKHLKLDKITKADLVRPVYNLLKGTCQSSIELEYNMEECYKALTDKLD
nr:hypothetical protein [Tanacetum cinerariifolium]